MKKKTKFRSVIALITISGLFLTGCGSSMPNLDAEQEEQIGEYAAMTLLQYDANNRSRLVTRDEVNQRLEKLADLDAKKKAREQAKENQETEQNPEGEKTQTEEIVSPGVQESLQDVLTLPEGITITYTGEQVCDSYPEEASAENYFALDASAGKKLLVLKFQISNQGEEAALVDILSQNAIFRVNVNQQFVGNSFTTMLDNDLSTYAGNINPGESRELVLLTEIGESLADSIFSVSINVKNESGRHTIQL